MKIELYAIKDELAGTFMQPMEFKSEAEAKRTFTLLINNKNSELMNNCPEDFSMWKIGTFEKNDGTITPELEKIVSGRTVWKGENNAV